MKTSYSIVLTGMMVLTFGCGAKSQQASELQSNYPPDYPISSACRKIDAVEVCRSYNYSAAYVRITYNGDLARASDLRVYLKINGKEGKFKMTSATEYSGYYYPAALSLSDGVHNCRSAANGSGWECDQATPEEKDLLFYVRNQFGYPNAVDVELAFFDSEGHWDSRFGENYKFRFETNAY